MLRTRIIFKDEAANGTDMVSTTLDVEDVERLLRVAKRQGDDFLAVPSTGNSASHKRTALVPLSNIAFVRSI